MRWRCGLQPGLARCASPALGQPGAAGVGAPGPAVFTFLYERPKSLLTSLIRGQEKDGLFVLPFFFCLFFNCSSSTSAFYTISLSTGLGMERLLLSSHGHSSVIFNRSQTAQGISSFGSRSPLKTWHKESVFSDPQIFGCAALCDRGVSSSRVIWLFFIDI